MIWAYIMANGEKLILASRHLVPRTAVCDPELTVGLPPRLLPEHCCHVGVGRVEANGDGFANRGSPTARAVVIATVPHASRIRNATTSVESIRVP